MKTFSLFTSAAALLLHSVCFTQATAQDCQQITPPPNTTTVPATLPSICKGTIAKSDTYLSTYSKTAVSLNAKGKWVADRNLFIPQGVGVKGFIASMSDVGATQAVANQVPADYYAMSAYGQPMLDAAINTFHANTLRFQVSQYAVAQYAASPNSSNAEAQFIGCLTNAVQMARNSGLLVVLAMQSEVDGAPASATGHTMLPVQETFNAWLYLNTLYARDRGVIYELYNEPNEPADPLVKQNGTQVVSPAMSLQNWLRYKCGDSTQVNTDYYNSCISDYARSGITPASPTEAASPFVGVQVIADALRSNGATNVLLVDGLTVGLTVNGIMGDGTSPTFLLHDTGPNPSSPSNRLVVPQIAYAVHPSPHGLQSPNYAAWFGGATSTATPTIAATSTSPALGPSTLTATVSTPAITAPVLVSEWSAASSATVPYCGLMLNQLNNFKPAIDLVDMLNRTGTPLLAGAMDAGGILSQSNSTTSPGHVPQPDEPSSLWTPTWYDNYLGTANNGLPACGTGGLNAGLLIANFFAAQSQPNYAPVTHQFTCVDAVSSADVPSTGCTTSANPNQNACMSQ